MAGLLALGALRAQELADPSADADTGVDTDLSTPASPAQLAPPTTPDEAAAMDQSLYGDALAETSAPAEPEAQVRPWKVNLHAGADSYYDNNIFISHNGKRSDLVTRLSAGGGLTLGDYTARQYNYLIADYTGIGEIFDRNAYDDAYEQTASLLWKLNFGHLTLTGEFELQDLADEDIDIGTRARRQISTGDFAARYLVSEKTYIEAIARLAMAEYTRYLDSNDELGGLSFNYLPDPDVTVGLGATAGVLNVQDAGSQTYEQLLGSAEFAPGGKFTLKADGGLEARQLQDGGTLVSPVFELTGDYKPFDGLDLSVTGFRRVENSASYTGVDYISTGVSAGIEYQLPSHFTCRLDGGYQHAGYRDVATGATISRTDEYLFVRPSLRYTASRFLNVELYYFRRNNASTVTGSSFEDTQVGMAVNLTF